MFKFLLLCAIVYCVVSVESAHEIEKRDAFAPPDKDFWGALAKGAASLVGSLFKRRAGEFDETDPNSVRWNWNWVKPVVSGAFNGFVDHLNKRRVSFDSGSFSPEETQAFRAEIEDSAAFAKTFFNRFAELKDVVKFANDKLNTVSKF